MLKEMLQGMLLAILVVLLVVVHGNAATSTKLQNARTISLTGGATGTATSFDGSKNVSIPVTGLDMSKANAGVLPTTRGGTGQSALQKQTVTLAKSGKITFRKFGKVVYAIGVITTSSSMISSNAATLPSWAKPSDKNILSARDDTGNIVLLKVIPETDKCSITTMPDESPTERSAFLTYIVD